jgi:HK97 family phage major capsid protein
VLEDNGYGDFAMELHQTNGLKKSINTLTNSAGGILMPQPARGELMDLIYPDTTFLRGNPQRVPLNGGRYEQPYGVTGATAAYVGESVKKPVSDLTFAKMSMTSKKLAAIVLITKEAQRWLFPDITNYVERNLRIVLPQTLNTAAYLGTGSGDTPLGILNTVGIGAYSAEDYAVDPLAPTIQELDLIATTLFMHMTTRQIGRNPSWAWVMSSRTVEWLRNFRIGSNLDLAFPEMQGDNPRWKGVRVLEEVAIPENTGTGTDETVIALINFNDVLFGEEEGLTTSFSDQATVDVSGTLVHLWQQNMFGLLAEMMHGFGVRRLDSVIRLNNVRWGAPAEE